MADAHDISGSSTPKGAGGPLAPGQLAPLPADPQELLGSPGEKPEAPRDIKQFVQMMAMSGSIPNPVNQKINETHISQVLQIAAQHDEREFVLADRERKRRESDRWFGLAVFAMILAMVVFVCLTFRDKAEVLMPVLTGVFGFGAGAMGGYGYGKSAKSEAE